MPQSCFPNSIPSSQSLARGRPLGSALPSLSLLLLESYCLSIDGYRLINASYACTLFSTI
ncbi:Uncharacterised protein [Vibrio cholerae]|nr:Uncharacterised protein [Vibrio cholerae]